MSPLSATQTALLRLGQTHRTSNSTAIKWFPPDGGPVGWSTHFRYDTEDGSILAHLGEDGWSPVGIADSQADFNTQAAALYAENDWNFRATGEGDSTRDPRDLDPEFVRLMGHRRRSMLTGPFPDLDAASVEVHTQNSRGGGPYYVLDYRDESAPRNTPNFLGEHPRMPPGLYVGTADDIERAEESGRDFDVKDALASRRQAAERGDSGSGGWGRWSGGGRVRINRPGMPDDGLVGTVTYSGRNVVVELDPGQSMSGTRTYDAVDLREASRRTASWTSRPIGRGPGGGQGTLWESNDLNATVQQHADDTWHAFVGDPNDSPRGGIEVGQGYPTADQAKAAVEQATEKWAWPRPREGRRRLTAADYRRLDLAALRHMLNVMQREVEEGFRRADSADMRQLVEAIAEREAKGEVEWRYSGLPEGSDFMPVAGRRPAKVATLQRQADGSLKAVIADQERIPYEDLTPFQKAMYDAAKPGAPWYEQPPKKDEKEGSRRVLSWDFPEQVYLQDTNTEPIRYPKIVPGTNSYGWLWPLEEAQAAVDSRRQDPTWRYPAYAVVDPGTMKIVWGPVPGWGLPDNQAIWHFDFVNDPA